MSCGVVTASSWGSVERLVLSDELATRTNCSARKTTTRRCREHSENSSNNDRFLLSPPPHDAIRELFRLHIQSVIMDSDHGALDWAYAPCLKRKTIKIVFWYNFVKFLSTSINFGTKMAKTIKLCKVHINFFLPHLIYCVSEHYYFVQTPHPRANCWASAFQAAFFSFNSSITLLSSLSARRSSRSARFSSSSNLTIKTPLVTGVLKVVDYFVSCLSVYFPVKFACTSATKVVKTSRHMSKTKRMFLRLRRSVTV